MLKYTALRCDTVFRTKASSTPLNMRSSWWTWIPMRTRRNSEFIGPGLTGNLLEVIMIELAGQRMLAIHAMPLRPTFFPLLTDGDG